MRDTMLAVCLMALPAAPLTAEENVPAQPLSAGDNAPAQVQTTMERIAPGVAIDAIERSPVGGLYQVRIGSEVVYISSDGRYLIQGNLVDLEEGVNITESVRKEARVAALSRVPLEDMVVFSPPDGSKRYSVSVFTDVDCPYCRKFHRDIQDYIDAGIEVRYLAYPRAGEGSETFDTMVSVWCADDTREAMTQAKTGQTIDEAQCDSPVAEQYRLGQEVGVRGTPTIITEDGTVVPGYVPADDLLGYLGSPGS